MKRRSSNAKKPAKKKLQVDREPVAEITEGDLSSVRGGVGVSTRTSTGTDSSVGGGSSVSN